MSTERGCGFRTKGGIYLCTGLSPDGSPIENFLIDPPIIISPAMFGLAPIGMALVERGGATHIMDWVGSQHYPNVADFIEETKRFGTSRRASPSLDFSRLTKESRHLFVHSRAGLLNAASYVDALFDEFLGSDMAPTKERAFSCPKDKHPVHTAEACIGLCWHDVEGGQPIEGKARWITRVMPSFSYQAHSRPATVEPNHAPAIFMSLPITSIQIVAGGADNGAAMEKAAKSQLPVLEVEA